MQPFKLKHIYLSIKQMQNSTEEKNIELLEDEIHNIAMKETYPFLSDRI